MSLDLQDIERIAHLARLQVQPDEAERLMGKAKAEAEAPLKAKLTAVVQKIGRDKGYAFILNTDNDATPYINPASGEDISAVVREAVVR